MHAQRSSNKYQFFSVELSWVSVEHMMCSTKGEQTDHYTSDSLYKMQNINIYELISLELLVK